MVETGTWIAIGAVASVLLLGVQLYRGRSDAAETKESAEDVGAAFMQHVTVDGDHATVSQEPTLEAVDGGGGKTESELKERAENLLYKDGRLSEAVMYARQFAEEKGLEQEAEFLRWEQLGIQEQPPPELEHTWETMAPYRKINVEIILPQEKFIAKPPVIAEHEVFWAVSVSQIEERVRIICDQDEGVLRAKLPLEQMVPPGSDPYLAYPGDVVHFLIPEEELRGIIRGVRQRIARLLADH